MPRISANRLNMEDGRIDRPVLKDYGETLVGGSAGTNTTATYTCDITNGNVYNLILSANCTFTFSNPSPVGTQCTLTIYLRQDGTGGRSVTWPTSVKWPGDVAPLVSTTATAQDIFTFWTIDSGSTWYGVKSGENFKAGGGFMYELWGWGRGSGSLRGDSTNRSSPVQVGLLTNWASASLGGSRTATPHIAAIKTDGSLWTWGYNTSGKLGLNNTTNLVSPVQVGIAVNWVQVSASAENHTAAIKTDGTLWTWGLGTNGRLGHNTALSLSSPTQVGTLTNWATTSAGHYHTAAIKTDGTLWTWGLGTNGRLGHNTALTLSSPVQVGTLTNWASVSAGELHTAAIKTDGTLWSWGAGSYNRLGLGTTTNRSSPVQVGTLANWSRVATNYRHSAATKTDGTLWTWGNNNSGQLGVNSATQQSVPTQVGALAHWVYVRVGSSLTAAITTDGSLWTWGLASNYGQLGLNEMVNRSSPSQVGISTSWGTVDAGVNQMIALQSP